MKVFLESLRKSNKY